ncbi:Mov34/MPN/PAD-1 family protein [Bradyrhizobium yuanmingense]|uniref:JAB domain-containing protein n=1 Tax=Bradyrhizobium yuanmingense TaxID=108015 RepID=A0ABV4GBK8_9BRAD|nr:Mov34/MPN/PAD-1 family protein [Bradyrhizobium yuanmingense]
MSKVFCKRQHIEETLKHLQEAGQRGNECVVLWFGRESPMGIEIEAVCRPAQVAGADIFRIPPPAMREIIGILAQHGWMIAAQVHSHPHEAFHSLADDKWAIVRHENALSLVVPYFAARTTAFSFMQDQKTFKLSVGNRWEELAAWEIGKWLQIS